MHVIYLTVRKKIRAYRTLTVLRLVQKIRTCKGEEDQSIRALKKRGYFRTDKTQRLSKRTFVFPS